MASTNEAKLAFTEASLTILLGALVARLFIGLVLSVQPFGERGVTAVAWAFLFWPGLIDLITTFTSGRNLFTADDIIVWATVSGGLVGFWDGLRRIHDWRRFGGLTFLLDVTWGGAGTSLGLAAHFLNLGWGIPIDSRRCYVHRYDAGVRTARDYAITLGNVCGNFQGRGEGPLLKHEETHVFQNRLFGPIYLFSYLFWMAAMLIPALVWGLIVGRLGQVIYAWSYANNPWEEWAYRNGGGRPSEIVWPTRRIVVVSFLSAIVGAGALIHVFS